MQMANCPVQSAFEPSPADELDGPLPAVRL